MDTKAIIWCGVVILLLCIMLMVYCLMHMASHADKLEEEMLREEGLFDGKDQ